nr:hypothetical protein [Pseudomonas chengduensis]
MLQLSMRVTSRAGETRHALVRVYVAATAQILSGIMPRAESVVWGAGYELALNIVVITTLAGLIGVIFGFTVMRVV